MAGFTRVGGPVFAGSDKEDRVNAGFVLTGKGVLVVDTLVTREDGVALLEAARSAAAGVGDGAKPAVVAVTALVYTHEHSDHTIGSTDFPPCGVLASEGTTRGLRAELERMAADFAGRGIAPKTPTLVFETRVRLPWAPEVVVAELGGHAEGSTVVYVPSAKVLFTGDLVFRGRAAWVGGIRPERWIAALRVLESWDVDVVVPGHGPVGGREILAEQRAWLECFLARARELRTEGVPARQATTILGDEFGFTERQRENLFFGLRRRLGLRHDEEGSAGGGGAS